MKQIKMNSLAKVVARRHRVRASDLTGQSRGRWVAHPRFKFVWIARYKLGHSTSVIGRFLGGRDHTTIIHASRQAEALGLISPETVDDILLEAEGQTQVDMEQLKKDAGVFA